MIAERQQVPQWLVERLALAELPAQLRDAVQARLRAEADGDARLAAIEESNHQILSDLPADQVVREIERRHRSLSATERRASRRRQLWVSGSLVVAAAAILLVFMLPQATLLDTATIAEAPEQYGTRAKGDARLLLHRKLDDGSEQLTRDSVARSGDWVQLSYRASDNKHGVIVSIDGRGQVTVHFPEKAGQSTRLRQGKTELKHSYELDDAPAFERFFLVTSTQPIDVELVTSRARDLANNLRDARHQPLALPQQLVQWSFVLRKGPAQ